MLFEAADGIRLWVAVMYIGAQSPLEEMTLSNGESMFLAEPEKEFKIMVTSLGPHKNELSIGCFVGELSIAWHAAVARGQWMIGWHNAVTHSSS